MWNVRTTFRISYITTNNNNNNLENEEEARIQYGNN